MIKRILNVVAVLVLAAAIVVAPATGVVPEENRSTAAAWSSGIDYRFCGNSYWKWDGSVIQATGRKKVVDGFTYREYERSMPGGFGYGLGWTKQWNACYGVLGNGPYYPNGTNYKGDYFS